MFNIYFLYALDIKISLIFKKMKKTQFDIILKQEILSNRDNFYTDNIHTCTSSHIEYISLKDRIKKIFFNLKSIGVNQNHCEVIVSDFSEVYEILEDDFSRDLMVRILAYRILGHRKYKLPLHTPEYWNLFERIELDGNPDTLDTINANFLGWQLTKFSLSHLREKIDLYYVPYGILNTFYLKQYISPSNQNIKAELGDIVIDAGGCWGDTALYFAGEVGELGKIYTFEFIPSNIKIMQDNINLNPKLKDLINIVERPLWESSEINMYCVDHGPASQISFEESSRSTIQVKTLTIDDFCQAEAIKQVNLIKMDIEGAEMNALKGSVITLEKFKPKLAISVYHKPDDMYTITMFLNSLNLGYKFYLGHFTIHRDETILYAIV
jgi:FkbM family methyltransferase